MFRRLSSLTIVYSNLVFNSSSITFFSPISDDFRPPSYHNFLYKLNALQFLTKCILLQMCLICLVSLPFLFIHTKFISNMIRGAYSGTTSGYLFISSLFSIMMCANSIPAVHATLYSISELYWVNGTGTCFQWSIGLPW